eukprot:GEMP01089063.1.p3 GENE.GEMP01089063.1~~GEMP01089063.1.p3  ORF type:complete len:102 (-),score=5.23 GEMP01089063.1:393-698(-)
MAKSKTQKKDNLTTTTTRPVLYVSVRICLFYSYMGEAKIIIDTEKTAKTKVKKIRPSKHGTKKKKAKTRKRTIHKKLLRNGVKKKSVGEKNRPLFPIFGNN